MSKSSSQKVAQSDRSVDEITDLMKTVFDDVAEVRKLVQSASEVRQRVLQTLDKLRREFYDHEPLVRHARALATWAEREIDDVVFCAPAEVPQMYRDLVENPETSQLESKAQARKRKRREEKEGREEIPDDAVIDFDKLNVQIPNQN